MQVRYSTQSVPAKLDETVTGAQVFYAKRGRGHQGRTGSAAHAGRHGAKRSRESEAVQAGELRRGHEHPCATADSQQRAQLKDRKEKDEHHPSTLAASKADEMRKRNHSCKQACKWQSIRGSVLLGDWSQMRLRPVSNEAR
ncbi:hypothetical protein [Paraburkholderia silvatlantica]|uniref:hypothetical protein n=1 Tax=Paraburkholderia silvatlantica TaxID=321895 RepID=UPI0011B7308E|nr:hypothetical protein [Paraburkholderia silvatlantica]